MSVEPGLGAQVGGHKIEGVGSRGGKSIPGKGTLWTKMEQHEVCHGG